MRRTPSPHTTVARYTGSCIPSILLPCSPVLDAHVDRAPETRRVLLTPGLRVRRVLRVPLVQHVPHPRVQLEPPVDRHRHPRVHETVSVVLVRVLRVHP